MRKKIKLYPLSKILPEDYEKWLENYEVDGWHLVKISFLGLIHYFIKDEPYKFRYCYDYQGSQKKDYEKIFSDLGWELVFYSFGSYIWRLEYIDERPEAFSDYDSLISRNNRLLSVYTGCLAVFAICSLNYTNSLSYKDLFHTVFYTFYGVLGVYTLFIVIRLVTMNRRLKRSMQQKL